MLTLYSWTMGYVKLSRACLLVKMLDQLSLCEIFRARLQVHPFLPLLSLYSMGKPLVFLKHNVGGTSCNVETSQGIQEWTK